MTLQDPPEAMGQLGLCLKRLIAKLADNCDSAYLFYFSEFDVKDGFWRVVVNDINAWYFCYVLPQEDGITVLLEKVDPFVPDQPPNRIV